MRRMCPKAIRQTTPHIIEAAQQESTLLIYSNVDAANWAPFMELVAENYPWITVETTDDSNMWEKYYAESSAGVESADMVLASHPDQWAEFIARDEVMRLRIAGSRRSAGLEHAGARRLLRIGRSDDHGDMPQLFRRRAARSLGETAQLLAERPDLEGKVAAMDPIGNLMGYAAWASWLEKNPDGWKLIEQIGPSLRPERSAGTVREKLLTGEYAVAIFTSGGGIPRYEEPANKELTAWGFSKDGTPVVTRNVGITKAADSPNSASWCSTLCCRARARSPFARRPDALPRGRRAERRQYSTLGASRRRSARTRSSSSRRKGTLAGSTTSLTRWNTASDAEQSCIGRPVSRAGFPQPPTWICHARSSEKAVHCR